MKGENMRRKIAVSLQVKIFIHSALGLIGTFFLLFGSLVTLALGNQADFVSVMQFRQSDPVVTGTLTGISATSYSEDDHAIYVYHYRYGVDSVPYTGQSFSRSRDLEPQSEVPVNYVPGNPSRSRIEGMRPAPFEWYVAPLTALFPLVGLVMVAHALGSTRRAVHLLRCGTVTTGQVTQKKATNMHVNGRTVYRLAFRYAAADGQRYEAWAASSRYWALQAGDSVKLLYDPANPADALPLASMPRMAEAFLSSGSRAA